MIAKVRLLALAAVIAAAGCLPSLNPVYTRQDLVMDPTLAGVWVQPNSKATWELTQRDDTSYTLVYTDDAGQEGRFVARLAEIQGFKFLDLEPEPNQIAKSDFFKLHLVPIHTIYRVVRTEPDVQLASIDYKWLEEHLREQPHALQHAIFDGRTLITAPTNELQEFVVQHRDRFTAMIELQRR